MAVGDGSDLDDAQLHFSTDGQELAAADAAKAAAQGDTVQSVSIATVDVVLASGRYAFKLCPRPICNRFFVMKIDVDGYELRALRGSALLLKTAAPPFIMIKLAPGTIKGALCVHACACTCVQFDEV